ncbi:MAG: MBL fold metallo-hydrolase [Eubacterium sp.]|nr:MBL fold metallo-hydrolase [Eubacterium sp.]
MNKLYKRFIILLLLATFTLGGIFSNPLPTTAANPDKMEVHFIDVGQGDATLITCGGHAMLIDSGDDTKGTAIQNYLKKQNIKQLDYLLLTHPDADHIGGAPVIITKFDIDKVFVSNYEKDTKAYQKLIQALDNKRLKYLTPSVGSQYSLGTAAITILAPNATYDNPNDASIACIIQNGNNKFLFTGDAGEEAEKDIAGSGHDISADVYHVGHHGSRYSTSKKFFDAVNPDYAVISCGEDNSYGHPHAETLNTLRMNGVKVYRTDEEGTVIATADGKKITFNVPASETWKAGEPTQNSSSVSAQESSKETNISSSAVQETPKETNNFASAIQEVPKQEASASIPTGITYVLNNNTRKFHMPSCSSVDTIKPKNREDTTMSREEVIGAGYVPCKRCNP